MAFRREDYSGIPATSALAMALMESSGIRQMIDNACEFDPQMLQTPGNAVKAMIGPIFDVRKKLPLSKIDIFYHSLLSGSCSAAGSMRGVSTTRPSAGRWTPSMGPIGNN